MKIEIKTNEKGICEYFIMNGKKYSEGIYALDIHIEGGEMPKVTISCVSKDFCLDCENAEVKVKNKK